MIKRILRIPRKDSKMAMTKNFKLFFTVINLNVRKILKILNTFITPAV